MVRPIDIEVPSYTYAHTLKYTLAYNENVIFSIIFFTNELQFDHNEQHIYWKVPSSSPTAGSRTYFN